MHRHAFVRFFVMLLTVITGAVLWSASANAMSPDAVQGLLGLGAVITCISAIWIIWILLAYWAYKDAQRRKMDSPLIWFLVVFFLGLLGLIIYLIVRPDMPARAQVPPPPPPPPP